MTVNKSLLTVSFPRVLGLVAILASLTILTLPNVGVTSAQTETETPAPGEGGDPGGPAAPVLSTTKGPGWITLSWEPVSGADTYDVWWRFADGGSWRQAEGSPISNTDYGFIGTSDGTTLDFLVRSIAADGKSSPWSALHQETAIGRLTPTPTPTPSPTPTVSSNLPAPAMTARQTEADAIELRWTEVSGADRYELLTWWATDPGWQGLGTSLRGTSYMHRGLTAGRTYHYAIRALDANGVAGAWTQYPYPTVTVQETSTQTPTPSGPTQTPTPTPTGPTTTATTTATAISTATPTATRSAGGTLPAPALTARTTETNAVELSWTEVSGADRYELLTWWATDPGWQGVGGTLRGTSYTHRGLTVGRTYHYAIRAVSANGAAGTWTQYPYPYVTITEMPTLTPTPAGPTPTPTPTPTGPTPRHGNADGDADSGRQATRAGADRAGYRGEHNRTQLDGSHGCGHIRALDLVGL